MGRGQAEGFRGRGEGCRYEGVGGVERGGVGRMGWMYFYGGCTSKDTNTATSFWLFLWDRIADRLLN